MTEKNCQKCGKVFSLDSSRLLFPNSIDALLCNRCLADWLVFFEKWNRTYSIKYPKKPNPTWEAFIGDISDISKEKVAFT